MLKRIQETVKYINQQIDSSPEVGIVLGTGLGGLVNEIQNSIKIPYTEIPNFPVSTVKGHQGQLIYGDLGGKKVIAMQGRFHYYEGYTMKEVVFPIRVMKLLGVKAMIVSNAAGGVNPDFEVGDIMIINDHINLMGDNPLLGPNEEEFGPRFPDMSEAYKPEYIKIVKDIAAQHNIHLQEGVYAGVTGPTFETLAEYKYIRVIGADAVGMSTVPEVITARHMGVPVFAVSVISDLGVEGKIVEITHEEVIQAAAAAEPKMTLLVEGLLKRL
jgi:purine-nucleoside phosphorylase